MTADQTSTAQAKITLSEAMDRITAGEVKTIEKIHGKNFEALSGTSLVAALVWAFERRVHGKEFTWADVDKMTMGQLNGYFAPEPEDTAELTESGNDSAPTV